MQAVKDTLRAVPAEGWFTIVQKFEQTLRLASCFLLQDSRVSVLSLIFESVLDTTSYVLVIGREWLSGVPIDECGRGYAGHVLIFVRCFQTLVEILVRRRLRRNPGTRLTPMRVALAIELLKACLKVLLSLPTLFPSTVSASTTTASPTRGRACGLLTPHPSSLSSSVSASTHPTRGSSAAPRSPSAKSRSSSPTSSVRSSPAPFGDVSRSETVGDWAALLRPVFATLVACLYEGAPAPSPLASAPSASGMGAGSTPALPPRPSTSTTSNAIDAADEICTNLNVGVASAAPTRTLSIPFLPYADPVWIASKGRVSSAWACSFVVDLVAFVSTLRALQGALPASAFRRSASSRPSSAFVAGADAGKRGLRPRPRGVIRDDAVDASVPRCSSDKAAGGRTFTLGLSPSLAIPPRSSKQPSAAGAAAAPSAAELEDGTSSTRRANTLTSVTALLNHFVRTAAPPAQPADARLAAKAHDAAVSLALNAVRPPLFESAVAPVVETVRNFAAKVPLLHGILRPLLLRVDCRADVTPVLAPEADFVVPDVVVFVLTFHHKYRVFGDLLDCRRRVDEYVVVLSLFSHLVWFITAVWHIDHNESLQQFYSATVYS